MGFRHALLAEVYSNHVCLVYSVTMMVGTPPLPFKMQIDTGSPWVWVPYTGCASCAGGAQTTGPNVSSTMTMPKDASGSPYTQVFGYGGGQVAGKHFLMEHCAWMVTVSFS